MHSNKVSRILFNITQRYKNPNFTLHSDIKTQTCILKNASHTYIHTLILNVREILKYLTLFKRLTRDNHLANEAQFVTIIAMDLLFSAHL